MKSTELEWTLRYRHGHGALGPYFEALALGRALATRDATGRVEFPPHPRDDGEWVELDGTGRVVALTHGPARLPVSGIGGEWTFALVAMTGADNHTFGRVLGEPGAVQQGDPVRLAGAAAEGAHPATALCFERVNG